MDYRFEQLDGFRAAGILHSGPYHEIGSTWEKFGPMIPPGAVQRGGKMVSLYFDDPTQTPPEKLHSCAAVTMPEGATVPEGLEFWDVDPGRWAVYTHKGEYGNLGEAWLKFYELVMQDHKLAVADTCCFEVYVSTPMDTAPSECVTELYIPLK